MNRVQSRACGLRHRPRTAVKEDGGAGLHSSTGKPDFGSGYVTAMDRATHIPALIPGLIKGDLLTSRLAVAGDTAFFTGYFGVYAYRCS